MDFIYERLAGLETISAYVYLLVLLGGVASALSICYVPVLVMFSSYMGGRAHEGVGKALRITTSFTIGMVITSAVIGVVAAFLGNSIMKLFHRVRIGRMDTGSDWDCYGVTIVGGY
jgi:cytochrome c-type biogenesis protein